jgi:hypothetical protein
MSFQNWLLGFEKCGVLFDEGNFEPLPIIIPNEVGGITNN